VSFVSLLYDPSKLTGIRFIVALSFAGIESATYAACVYQKKKL
jgi:hypothetical protein